MAILGAINWDSTYRLLESTSLNNPLYLSIDPNLGYARAYYNMTVDLSFES